MGNHQICKHFGNCGGCLHQDWDYPHELADKSHRLKGAFKEAFKEAFPKDDFNPDVFHPIVFDEAYHYRTRMDFLFHDYQLCLRKKGNFRFKVPLEQCLIAHSNIDFHLKHINKWFQKHKKHLPFIGDPDNFNRRLLKYVVIRKSFNHQDTSITFIVNKNSSDSQLFYNYLKDHLDEIATPPTNILWGMVGEKQEITTTANYKILRGNDYLCENLLTRPFLFHSQGFFQNNTKMIEKIISTIEEWIIDFNLPRKKLFDLYGGCGVLGISLANLFEEVWIVDLESLNINYAEKNFINNKIVNGKIMALNVKDFLDIDDYFKQASQTLAILDPPRSGLNPKVIKRLLKRKPQAIIYISCKFEVLAEEVASLLPLYKIIRIQPFDLFPRTPHMEVVALLIKRD